ncbi:endonuclease/exonuclease/phosphatase family protein [Photobacterium kagoshimensis]|uniref:endonuclease/exonuclease/phosphatase family protein n=1 Tax=Photobacterium kagoshimensis TaxID=2910242 RepID=UPI003D0CF3FF
MPADTATDIINNTLKIATFNLFNYIEPPLAYYDFENIYSQDSWQKKQNWICDYLMQYQPDVIGFQEVFSADALQALLAEHGYCYFCVVDNPTVIDDYICRDPVVALASRYPIKAVAAITADPDIAASLGISTDFAFSRKPLRATIDLPHIGDTDCYVVHLKSKRPMLEATTDNATTADASLTKAHILATLKAEVMGSWGSSIQRGSEAAILYHAIIERREESGHPVILMGDFNDDIQQTPLQCLTTHSVRDRQVSDQKHILDTFWLTDSFTLFQTTDHADNKANRSPTHYYGAKGSVLDYILLSSEFNAEYNASLFEVSDYQTYDRHLINPIFARDSNSTDHGIVNITLKLRS